MMHGIGRDFLYSAYQLIPKFTDDIGNSKIASGTGFFVKNRRGQLCLVTNKHVLDPVFPKEPAWLMNAKLHSVRVRGKAQADNGRPDLQLDHIIAGEFRVSRANDIAVGINISIEEGTGPERIDYFIPYEMIATAADFENNFGVCDFVAFPGYPEWHDRKTGRPIFRAGTIASDPRYDYSFRETVSGQCVAYEAFSYGGSSGSPVFSFRKGFPQGGSITMTGSQEVRLVGVNAGHLNASPLRSDGTPGEILHHSGISYFFKSTAILELIDA